MLSTHELLIPPLDVGGFSVPFFCSRTGFLRACSGVKSRARTQQRFYTAKNTASTVGFAQLFVRKTRGRPAPAKGHNATCGHATSGGHTGGLCCTGQYLVIQRLRSLLLGLLHSKLALHRLLCFQLFAHFINVRQQRNRRIPLLHGDKRRQILDLLKVLHFC